MGDEMSELADFIHNNRPNIAAMQPHEYQFLSGYVHPKPVDYFKDLRGRSEPLYGRSILERMLPAFIFAKNVEQSAADRLK